MRTIAAVSTPRGVGAVSMIRLSGDDALEIAQRVFEGAKPLSETEAYKAVHGVFKDRDGAFDDGLCLVFRAPRSYTGEDTAELYCHGGLLCTRRLLAATIAAGAAPAGAGEYTKRAFINGKISLSQAEAVGALIEAKTDAALDVGIRQLGGALSRKIGACYEALLRLTASVYAYIDYPDEDMTELSPAELSAELSRLGDELSALKESYRYGKAISEGVRCAIVGCPNVGKSSVLNLLAGEERAIVTPYAGTTRDVVTETVRLGDILLHLSDTAGIRSGGGEIERLGIDRSLKSLQDAELVLAVFDGSKRQSETDFEVVARIEAAGKTAVTIGLVNKNDKGATFEYALPFGQISVSARTGAGFEELKNAAAEILYGQRGGRDGADSAGGRDGRDGADSADGAGGRDGANAKANAEAEGAAAEAESGEVIANARQYGAVCRALDCVESAQAALKSGFPQDVAGLDMEGALSALGELDGRSVGEEIVNDIFSHFCVGK